MSVSDSLNVLYVWVNAVILDGGIIVVRSCSELLARTKLKIGSIWLFDHCYLASTWSEAVSPSYQRLDEPVTDFALLCVCCIIVPDFILAYPKPIIVVFMSNYSFKRMHILITQRYAVATSRTSFFWRKPLIESVEKTGPIVITKMGKSWPLRKDKKTCSYISPQ